MWPWASCEAVGELSAAGEHKVSRGESRVSRQVGLPHNLRAPRSKPKNGLPLFLAAFSRLLLCRHGGATGVIGIGQMLLGKTPPFPGTAEPVPLPPPSARPIVHGVHFGPLASAAIPAQVFYISII
jgi:hypothetical protein